ncbi:MAG: hypothetical protein LCH95_17215 [Proteobacteria bacterium]|nr:hypothetical protein [Pseudomonadota bacterium]
MLTPADIAARKQHANSAGTVAFQLIATLPPERRADAAIGLAGAAWSCAPAHIRLAILKSSIAQLSEEQRSHLAEWMRAEGYIK